MKKILCPTDYSDRSLEIYRFASNIALSLPADLILYHASVKSLGNSDAHYFKDPKDLPANMEIANKKILENWQQLKNSESQSGKRVHYDFVIEEGFPLASIIRFVEKNGIDLVVMHTKADHRNKYEGVYIGSVGAQVVEDVKCPVLLVPPGTVHENISKMVYAIDFETYNEGCIKQALVFAKSFGATLTFFHMGEPDSDKVNKLKADFATEIEGNMVDIHIVEASDFVDGLNNFIQSHETDLLIMERHEKNILEKLFSKSLLKAVEKHAEIPLLIMHVDD